MLFSESLNIPTLRKGIRVLGFFSAVLWQYIHHLLVICTNPLGGKEAMFFWVVKGTDSSTSAWRCMAIKRVLGSGVRLGPDSLMNACKQKRVAFSVAKLGRSFTLNWIGGIS